MSLEQYADRLLSVTQCEFNLKQITTRIGARPDDIDHWRTIWSLEFELDVLAEMVEAVATIDRQSTTDEELEQVGEMFDLLADACPIDFGKWMEQCFRQRPTDKQPEGDGD